MYLINVCSYVSVQTMCMKFWTAKIRDSMLYRVSLNVNVCAAIALNVATVVALNVLVNVPNVENAVSVESVVVAQRKLCSIILIFMKNV